MTDGRLADESGASLVEVMVAVAVLALAVIPLVGMFEAGLRAVAASGDYDRARALANAQLEGVRALPYSKPGGAADSAVELHAPPGGPEVEEGRFAYTVRTDFVDGGLSGRADGSATGQMRVEVEVRWEGGSYATAGVVSGEPP